MTRKIRILLADDHAMVRDGLSMLIDAQPDLEVVAQAASGGEALALASRAEPDIVLLDVSMPDIGGAEAAERIRAACPEVRIIALTRHADAGYVRRMMSAGASGYVLKRTAGEALINAIRVVSGGGVYLEPALAGAVVDRAYGTAGASAQHAPADLSPREEEVLRLIAWGRSNKEIAAQLELSVKTVESYKAGAVEKLELHSRGEIVRYALSRGWLNDDAAPE